MVRRSCHVWTIASTEKVSQEVTRLVQGTAGNPVVSEVSERMEKKNQKQETASECHHIFSKTHLRPEELASRPCSAMQVKKQGQAEMEGEAGLFGHGGTAFSSH